MISVLLPTRHRPIECLRAINSLLELAENVDDIEVLLAVDDDDAESIDILCNSKIPQVKTFIYPRYGYGQINTYCARLHENINSKSKQMFMYNDDAIMISGSWDAIIREHDDKFSVLVSSSHICDRIDGSTTLGVDCPGTREAYPVIPSQWIDIVGRWSNHMCIDTWVCDVARLLDILVDEPRFKIHHDRTIDSGAQDFVDQEKTQSIINAPWNSNSSATTTAAGYASYYSSEMDHQRRIDAYKIIASGVLGD